MSDTERVHESLLHPHTLPIEIERFQDTGFGDRLINADIAHLGQKREVDHTTLIFLVVCHQLIQPFIVGAIKAKRRVILLYILDYLKHLPHREATHHM